jgi:hypothetical protein
VRLAHKLLQGPGPHPGRQGRWRGKETHGRRRKTAAGGRELKGSKIMTITFLMIISGGYFLTPAAPGEGLAAPPGPTTRDNCHFRSISGRYSKCIRSKCDHLPPQIKPCFSNISTISWG